MMYEQGNHVLCLTVAPLFELRWTLCVSVISLNLNAALRQPDILNLSDMSDETNGFHNADTTPPPKKKE